MSIIEPGSYAAKEYLKSRQERVLRKHFGLINKSGLLEAFM
jgi:hypothetical protein